MPSENVPTRNVSTRHARTYPYAPVSGALRAVESFLLAGGQRTARQNAWAAVVADRRRARDRREAAFEMDALTGRDALTGAEPLARPR